jgi:hypothetical protein
MDSGKNNNNKTGEQSSGNLLKNTLFVIIIVTMITTGFYCLYLASSSANKTKTFNTENLFRKAFPTDVYKIETALGHFFNSDLVFVLLDSSKSSINPNLEFSAMSATKVLADSGVVSSIRVLYPDDNDFTAIVVQNDISRFPAVLAVKKEGGIIQITNDHSEEYLLFAYNTIWGKTSDCSDDKSAVY